MIYFLLFCLAIDTALGLLFYYLFDGAAALLAFGLMLLHTITLMIRLKR